MFKTQQMKGSAADGNYGSAFDPTFTVTETDPMVRIEAELSDENSIRSMPYSTFRGPTFEPPLTADELAERRAIEEGRSCGVFDPPGILDITPMAAYIGNGGIDGDNEVNEAVKARTRLADAF